MKFEFYSILFKDWLKLGGEGGGDKYMYLYVKLLNFFKILLIVQEIKGIFRFKMEALVNLTLA